MFNKKLFLTVSFSALVLSQPSNAVIGPIKITLNPTELSSNYFNEVDTFAPFSSEVYTEDDIKVSKASDVYDFLTQNTSLALAPSSGNRFSQSISTRGFGLTEGYQNIVFTLNGRRLNNIDMTNSNLGSIDISNIKKGLQNFRVAGFEDRVVGKYLHKKSLCVLNQGMWHMRAKVAYSVFNGTIFHPVTPDNMYGFRSSRTNLFRYNLMIGKV